MSRKLVFPVVIMILLSTMFVSCSSSVVVVGPKNSAPGQVKKATGSKSAKSFAPGQQKKKQ